MLWGLFKNDVILKWQEGIYIYIENLFVFHFEMGEINYRIVTIKGIGIYKILLHDTIQYKY